MSLHTFTTDEKIEFVEKLIEVSRAACRAAGQDSEAFHKLSLLKAIALDLRALKLGAPSEALTTVEMRINSVARSKTALGYSSQSLIGLANDVVARWPVLKISLELFGKVAEDTNALADK